jgi:hypothetical protein
MGVLCALFLGIILIQPIEQQLSKAGMRGRFNECRPQWILPFA